MSMSFDMKITREDEGTWMVDGNEVWYHTKRKVYFCWGCGSFECVHVQALEQQLSEAVVIVEPKKERA